MVGPGISDPTTIVQREVPEADIEAYRAAGYKLGTLPEPEPAAETPNKVNRRR